jgi:hypothetical protein
MCHESWQIGLTVGHSALSRPFNISRRTKAFQMYGRGNRGRARDVPCAGDREIFLESYVEVIAPDMLEAPTVDSEGTRTSLFLAPSGGSLRRSDSSAIGGIADLPGACLKRRS